MSEAKGPPSNFQTIFFIIILCSVTGFLLALAAFGLQNPQKRAKEFDQSKQMLIASKILNHEGIFEILEKGQAQRAKFDAEKKILVVADGQIKKATEAEIRQVALTRIRPLVVTDEGDIFTLEEKNLDLQSYLSKYKKTGYASAPLKLFYAILPNSIKSASITEADLVKNIHQVDAIVIPVSGFGLWAPIYGYIALEPNGNTVIGTTWYEHGETPGLGANITAPWWQNQFFGKVIFQETAMGKVDFKTAPIGIIVVKGRVQDVFGNSPKSKSAVDGMSGATLTGDGVTIAYHNSLTPYRKLFIKLEKNHE